MQEDQLFLELDLGFVKWQFNGNALQFFRPVDDLLHIRVLSDDDSISCHFNHSLSLAFDITLYKYQYTFSMQ